eukprot:TRINITY_DN35877_c0_g1_i1.p3 TRINITY_DN35877_c0_g1~~TRINITY_DN35877_c0_g1_i1.p3  ORF type:complete len:193 (+),score=35.54 TRINITY_DN35877_c0_g1_i1:238-816(+)
MSKIVKKEQSSVQQFLHQEKEFRKARDEELLRLQQQIACSEALPPSKTNWQQVKQQAIQRYKDENVCAICYTALFDKKKPLALLSCAHIYHWNCLMGFERYTEGCKCPMCRQGYEKVLMAEIQEEKKLQSNNILQKKKKQTDLNQEEKKVGQNIMSKKKGKGNEFRIADKKQQKVTKSNKFSIAFQYQHLKK